VNEYLSGIDNHFIKDEYSDSNEYVKKGMGRIVPEDRDYKTRDNQREVKSNE